MYLMMYKQVICIYMTCFFSMTNSQLSDRYTYICLAQESKPTRPNTDMQQIQDQPRCHYYIDCLHTMLPRHQCVWGAFISYKVCLHTLVRIQSGHSVVRIINIIYFQPFCVGFINCEFQLGLLLGHYKTIFYSFRRWTLEV